LSKIPQVTQAEVTVHISLNGPRRWFGEHEIWHWWTVEIDKQFIQIRGNGHFYRKSTGGDSFTSLIWSAWPGKQATCLDYLDKLWMVDDSQPFPEEIASLDLTKPGFSLEVVKQYVDQNHPVIVLVQAWAEKYMTPEDWKKDNDDGHYVIIIGQQGEDIVFEDPASFRRTWMTEKEFLTRWHDVDPRTQEKLNRFAMVLLGKQPAQKVLKHMD